MEINTTPNREYKNTVFTLLFGTPEEAARMCNTIFGTNYGPDDIEIVTLMNVLYRGRINDLAFMVDGKLVILIEHQSTINKNMAIRMLQYYTETSSLLTDEENLYSGKKILLAQPIFIVLYNGVEEMDDEMEMKLSDHYIKNTCLDGQPFALDLTVKIYNINKGHNPHLAERNPTLYGYESFIAMIRDYQKTMSLEESIKKAVHDCINQNILKDFLDKHKKEVCKMLLTEWTFEKELDVAKRAAKEEHAMNMAKKMIAKDRPVDEIVEFTGLDLNTVLMLQSEIANAQ